MSDEPVPTPSLRLKPRIRPVETGTPAPGAPETAPATPIASGGSIPPAPLPVAGSVPDAASEAAPRIRLKPRISVDEPAPQSPADEQVPTGAGAGVEPTATVPPAIPAILPEEAPSHPLPSMPPIGARPPVSAASTVPATPPPAVFAAGDPSSAGELAKLKLKPKTATTSVQVPAIIAPAVGAPTAPAESAQPPPIPTTAASTPPPIPPSTPPSRPIVPPSVGPGPIKPAGIPIGAPIAPKGVGPIVPHVNVRKEIQAPIAPDNSDEPKSKRGLIIGGVAAAVLLAAFVGFKVLTRPSAPAKTTAPKPVATKPAPAPVVPKPQPAPAEPVPAAVAQQPSAPKPPAENPPAASTAPSIAHVPKQAIDKAQAAANAQRPRVSETNQVMDSSPSTPAATRPASTPKPPPAVVDSTTTELAPGVSASTTSEGSSEASAAFKAFVANLHIGGVASGASPRVLVNGRLVHVGDVIDASLGVSFAGIEDHNLVFKDRDGAKVTRHY